MKTTELNDTQKVLMMSVAMEMSQKLPQDMSNDTYTVSHLTIGRATVGGNPIEWIAGNQMGLMGMIFFDSTLFMLSRVFLLEGIDPAPLIVAKTEIIE